VWDDSIRGRPWRAGVMEGPRAEPQEDGNRVDRHDDACSRSTTVALGIHADGSELSPANARLREGGCRSISWGWWATGKSDD